MTENKQTEKKDIARDWNLIKELDSHIHVFGFASVIDNLVAACEDKINLWRQRLEKAKKLRKTLGDNYGRN